MLRRNLFKTAAGLLLTAPAIVHAGNIMSIVEPKSLCSSLFVPNRPTMDEWKIELTVKLLEAFRIKYIEQAGIHHSMFLGEVETIERQFSFNQKLDKLFIEGIIAKPV